MLQKVLQKIVNEKKEQNIPNFVIINFIKEYLQYPVLNFLYGNKKYKNFVFTGGSCLRICYGLPRLSEDLDFDLSKKDFEELDLKVLSDDLSIFFKKNYLFSLEPKIQSKQRLYLKFPILRELGLSTNNSESNFVYVKIEPTESDYLKPEVELNPIFNFTYNFVVKNYSLKYLMTGKIRAILNRTWLKGTKNEIDIKGRDFYDLFWYLQNKIEPDFKELKIKEGISNMAELKSELRAKIKKNITGQKLSYDLKNFFTDQNFINDFCDNYKLIIEKYLK